MKEPSRIFTFFLAFFLSFSLHSEAQDFFSSLRKKLSTYKETGPKERVVIITDRDIYTPEELVWFDVTTFDYYAPKVCNYSREVKVYLVDKWGKEVYGKKVALNAGGADGFIQIPKDFTDGVYYIQATTENVQGKNYYQKKIVIKNHIVPRFVIEASFPDKEYIPGDQLDMELAFKNLNYESKRNVEYQVNFYDGEFELPGASGKSDKTGKATVPVKVPLNLKSREFSYEVYAKSKKIESSLTGKFPVLTDQLYIDFYPENGRIIGGINTTIRAHAYDISGFPLAIEADVLEDGKPILSFTSTPNGLGSFEFTPEIGRNYEVQLKRPLFLENKYDLPPIEGKGIALEVSSKDQSIASYVLTSGYKTVHSMFLVGFSDGEIFWTSEHELERELQVDIDFTKASGRLAHLVAFDASGQIEGEHLILIPGKQPAEAVGVTALESSMEKRGRSEYQANIQSEEEGKLVFTAVNNPWIIEDINNQNIASIGLPSDLYRQSVFQGVEFNQSDLNDEVLEKYVNYYVPSVLGMEKVFSSTGAFRHINEQLSNKGTLKFTNPFISQFKEVKSGGGKTQTNILVDNNFAASNKEFVTGLFKNKNLNSKPAYKEMLEKNVPVMEVLQVVKPYSLVGNNIVFVSSALSISSQGGALIVIDGIASGTDPSAIRSLNPLTVETMSASTQASDIQRYSGFNTVGIIEITLKDGSESEEDTKEIDEDTKFTSPDYDSEKLDNDFRQTLFWGIYSVSPPATTHKFEFFNSDLVTIVKGNIYFIPKTGVPRRTSFEFEVK